MYDPKSEPREFLGDDASDAIAKAASYFGLDGERAVGRARCRTCPASAGA